MHPMSTFCCSSNLNIKIFWDNLMHALHLLYGLTAAFLICLTFRCGRELYSYGYERYLEWKTRPEDVNHHIIEEVHHLAEPDHGPAPDRYKSRKQKRRHHK